MRDLLASYYGMSSGKDDADAPPVSSQQPQQSSESNRGGNHGRGNNSSNKSMAAGRGQPAPQWQIDSSSFDAPGLVGAFVTALFNTYTLGICTPKEYYRELTHESL
jgi:hypothetical protein